MRVRGAQVAAVHEEVRALLREVRPDAVVLVDAFGLDDYFLNSALGASCRCRLPSTHLT